MSAAWDGEGKGRPGREEEESWNTLFQVQQEKGKEVENSCREGAGLGRPGGRGWRRWGQE